VTKELDVLKEFNAKSIFQSSGSGNSWDTYSAECHSGWKARRSQRECIEWTWAV